jgi:hypothetical protein
MSRCGKNEPNNQVLKNTLKNTKGGRGKNGNNIRKICYQCTQDIKLEKKAVERQKIILEKYVINVCKV